MENKKIVVINGKEYTVISHNPNGTHADSQPEVKEFFYKEKILSRLIDYKEEKNLLTLKTHGKEIEIGGDAIISVNTTIGCILRLTEFYRNLVIGGGELSQLKTQEMKIQKIIDEGILTLQATENLKNLSLLYHTKANFMPLPTTGINQFRGQNKGQNPMSDFPDKFLNYVRVNFYYCKTDDANDSNFHNEHYNYKIKENDIEYFLSYGEGNEGWKSFINSNFLQDYFCDADEDFEHPKKLHFEVIKPIQAKKETDSTEKRQKEYEDHFKNIDKDEKIKEISEFLKTAIKIIERRNERIAETYK